MTELKIARLLLYQGQTVVRRIAVKQNLIGAITIGRKGFGSIIDLDATYVSRKHAAIYIKDGQALVVKDLESTAGTFINGSSIGTEERVLHEGDRLTFGGDDFWIKVELLDLPTNQQTNEPTNQRTNEPTNNEPTNNDQRTITKPTNRSAYVPRSTVLERPRGMEIRNTGDQQVQTDIAELMSDRSQLYIGRSRECDIMLPQLTITRRHALITKHPEGRFTVRDLGSKNGTYVNGKRIEQETVLSEKDTLSIGAYAFHLRQPAKTSADKVLLWPKD